MRKTYPHVDDYLQDQDLWQEELSALVDILRDTELEETTKWSTPVYVYRGTNLVGLGAFKNHCAISFFNGALLPDPEGVLTKPGENTQAGRWIKYTSLASIQKDRKMLQQYIQDAMDAERAGLKVEMKTVDDYEVPEELTEAFKTDAPLAEAWGALTPGRQRAYILFIAGAKQSATRADRIAKYRTRILKGKGMNDCICGLSKRMPNCDGSHKQLQNA